MKTSKFFVTALISGLLLVSSVSATEGDKPSSASSAAYDMVRSQIVNALSDVAAVNQEVVIRFEVNEKKDFKLLKVEGKNNEVVNAVKFELMTERINVPTDMAGFYSIKVRFAESELTSVDPSSELRLQLAEALSGVKVSEPASVKVAFSVVNNGITLKKVEGTNKTLVADVETALAGSKIVPSAELAGNYQVVVKF